MPRGRRIFIFDRSQKFLYTCNSTHPEFTSQKSGGISSYSVDPKTGALTLLNSVASLGEDPSYISLDKNEHFCFVANYKTGSVAAFALRPDGRIGNCVSSLQYPGHGTDPVRQTQSHAHSIIADPTNHYVLVADLGLDTVSVYRFENQAGWLLASDPPLFHIKAGSGARHMAFDSTGKFLYVISEMGSLITVLNWDSSHGSASMIQEISTLPEDFKGTSAAAEITIHKSGKFLFATNRGDNSLAVFTIEASTGRLSLLQHISSAGKTPRNFAIDPTGRWIVATNHDSNNAVVFAIDQETGRLTQKGEPVGVTYPFCPRFWKAGN